MCHLWQTNTVFPEQPVTRKSDTHTSRLLLSILNNTVHQRCWSAAKRTIKCGLCSGSIIQPAVSTASGMAFFQPRLVTLVPIATFRPSQTPKLWTFDDMDDMVELQDDPELYQAGSQEAVPTGRYVTIINAYGHSRRSSESSSLASLPEDGDRPSDNSTAEYSGTNIEAGGSSSSSRQSSSFSNDLVRISSVNKLKRVLSKYAAKLRRSSSSKDQQRVSCSSGSSNEAFITPTVCGASQACLVFSPQALKVKTKQWQQASNALAGFTNWWKS